MEQKDIRVIGSEPIFDYVDGKATNNVGTKYKCIIVTDQTDYSDGSQDLNTGEQLNIKISAPAKPYKKFDRVVLKNPIGKIYGEFQNNLSLTADDIEFQGK